MESINQSGIPGLDNFIGVLKKYADFSGRATRSEYWWFLLYNIIIAILVSIINTILISVGLGTVASIFSLVLMIIYLALIIPGIAVSVRRMHDVGKSGWFLLLGLIPLIGIFIVLYFLILDSEAGANLYGPNPKG